MTPKAPKKLAPRKLLVAALGVATVNYVAIACTPTSPPTSGNLATPEPLPDAALGATPNVETPPKLPPATAGNLPAPQMIDAAPPPRPDAGKR